MRALHGQLTRGAATQELIAVPIGQAGKILKSIAARASVGYRNLPFYLAPQGDLTLDTIIPLVPATGPIQGPASTWLSWDGEIPISGDAAAVLVDISECAATTDVDVRVGVSDE